MQRVVYMEEAENYDAYLDAKVIDYIQSGNTEAFESFQRFSLFVFPLYDIRQPGQAMHRVMVYLDNEDLFFLCDGRKGYGQVCSLMSKEETNEKALWVFFQNLLRYDMDNLEDMECEIAEAEMAAMVRFRDNDIRKIISYRKQLLRLKRYYEQLDAIMDSLTVNENHLLTEEGVCHFRILANRTSRYLTNVLNLRDYVTQMREAYQAQLDIEQNNLMRVFTVLTSVFLPLTLMVGWYGMNFTYMPELGWRYGYWLFIGVSVLVCAVLLIYFKKRKWI